MQLTPRQRVWIRRIARESSAGAGTFMGVGLSLALIYRRIDVWLIGMVVIGLAMSALGLLLIPLYAEDLEDD
jgi:hypothetical protein